MERLTGRRDGRAYIVGCPDFALPKIVGLIIQQTVDRLAAYEDTGREPEEIELLAKQRDLYVDACGGLPLKRVRELAQADREGISPCTFCRFNPPSSSDGKPCCMCPAEAALRRERR